MDIGVKIKKLRPDAKIPVYATEGSAAADICYAGDADMSVAPGECAMVPTGLSISMARGDVAAFIYARSGLASKRGVAPANCVGVVDSDYRGEIKVALRNHSKEEFVISPGDRIAQLLIAPVLRAVYEETDELDETERSDGGFGSTGIK